MRYLSARLLRNKRRKAGKVTIICHVSDKKLDFLIPQKPTNAICFSEDKFITFFGQYLYLFDLKIMVENFNIQKVETTGLTSLRYLPYDQVIRYDSQSLEYEWRVFEPISVERFSLGVIEHWDHLSGTIGKGSVDESLEKIAINLMSQNGISKI